MLNYIIIKHTQLTLGTKYRYYTQSTGKVPNIVPKSKVLNTLSHYRIIKQAGSVFHDVMRSCST